MRKLIVIFALLAVALVGGYVFTANQQRAATAPEGVDTVTVKTAWVEVVSEPVYLVAAGEKTPLQSGDVVGVGATIETGSTGAATVHFPDASLARIDVNTTLTLSAVSFNASDNSLVVGIGLSVGRVWSKVIALATPKSSWEVRTSNAVATVRGTAFGVGYKDGASWVLGSEHTVAVAPIDPKTKQRVAGAEVLLGEERLIQLNNQDAAAASTAIGSSTVAAKITPIIGEFRTNAWIRASQAADTEFDAKIDMLRAQNADATSLYERIRQEDMQLRKTFIQKSSIRKREAAPADESNETEKRMETPSQPTPPKNKVETAPPVRTSPAETAPTTIIDTASTAPVAAPTKATMSFGPTNNLTEGDTVQFRAMAGTQDITNEVSWKVVGPIGSITPKGLFIGLLGNEVSEFGLSVGYVSMTLRDGSVIKGPFMYIRAKVDPSSGTAG